LPTDSSTSTLCQLNSDYRHNNKTFFFLYKNKRSLYLHFKNLNWHKVYTTTKKETFRSFF